MARDADPADPESERVCVKRFPDRGRYNRETINAILDGGLVCHIGFVFDGYPVVIPTFYWREGDHLYWHGSVRSRMLGAVQDAPVCVTVTQLDGVVCARSAFNHSANYRSVTLFGTATALTEPEQKARGLRAMVESIFPGRWEQLRPVTAKELAATRVMSIPIREASAKVREGPPNDLQDVDWPVWAGVIPLSTIAGDPKWDGHSLEESPPAPSILRPR